MFVLELVMIEAPEYAYYFFISGLSTSALGSVRAWEVSFKHGTSIM